MPSFTCLHYHLVFSTRDREPTITPDLRPRLWDYLGGIIRAGGGIPHEIGGTADHVHLLVTLRQQPAVCDVLRVLKCNSSGWAHDTFSGAGLWWQSGYGAFTVSHSGLGRVKAYIANQEARHRNRTYKDEYRAILTRHGVEWDERYVWQ